MTTTTAPTTRRRRQRHGPNLSTADIKARRIAAAAAKAAPLPTRPVVKAIPSEGRRPHIAA